VFFYYNFELGACLVGKIWWWIELAGVLAFFATTAMIAWKVNYSGLGTPTGVGARVEDFLHFLAAWVVYSLLCSLPFVWAANFWEWLNTADTPELRLAAYAVLLFAAAFGLGHRQRAAPVLWAWLMAAAFGGALIVHWLPNAPVPP
jgi:hypothetical protein